MNINSLPQKIKVVEKSYDFVRGEGSKSIKQILGELRLQDRHRRVNQRRERYDSNNSNGISQERESQKRALTDYDQDIEQFKKDLKVVEQSNNKKAYISVKNYLEMQDHQIKMIKNCNNSAQMDKLTQILKDQDEITPDILSLSPLKFQNLRRQRSYMSYHDESQILKGNLNKNTSRNNLSVLEKSPPSRFSTINNDTRPDSKIEYKYVELPSIQSNSIQDKQFDFSEKGIKNEQQRIEELNSSIINDSSIQESIQSPQHKAQLREKLIPQIDEFFRGRTAQHFVKRARSRNNDLGDKVLKINDNKAKIMEMYEYHTKNSRQIEKLVSDDTVKPFRKFAHKSVDPQRKLFEQIENTFMYNEEGPYNFQINQIRKNVDSKREKRLNTAFNQNQNTKVCNAAQNQITIKQITSKIFQQSRKKQIECNSIEQTNVDPVRVHFFSVAKEIIQYHQYKSKGNDNLMRLLEQSMANRKEIILDKLNVINSINEMSPQNQDRVRYIMRRKFHKRINLNSDQIAKFLDMLDFLKDSNMAISENLKIALKELRILLIQGKILKNETFQEIILQNNLQLNDIQVELIQKHLINSTKV
ncbi:hypothetical protein ABPG72_019337 [Tetrahymena utriculariae]